MIQTYIIIAAVSYLLGSIPFGYILVRLFMKQDIRQSGSGNIGATNVARSGAKGLAIATLLLDAGKGYLAVGLGTLLPQKGWPAVWWINRGPFVFWPLVFAAALAALFAIIGH